MKLYVLVDKDGYIKEYKFSKYPMNDWILTDEKEVDEQTPFSKLVDGKFILDEVKWQEYQELILEE